MPKTLDDKLTAVLAESEGSSATPRKNAMVISAKIKSAKLNCRTEMNLCIAEADTTADPKAAKVECKVEYKQCVSEDVHPLVDSTPLGACKATYASCKTAVKGKANTTNPGVKPEKSEYLPCANEYRACVKTVKEAR